MRLGHKAEKPSSSPLAAFVVSTRGPSISKRLILVTASTGVLIVCAVGTFLWFNRLTPSSKATTQTEQLSLQTSLTTALFKHDNATVVSTTKQLINGTESGSYTVSKKDLAQDYLYQGVSLINLKQYTQAIVDFQKAPKTDNNEQFAALQGEIQARYLAGQRQQLIPALQQLVVLSKQHSNSLYSTPALYQQDIQDIKNNQAISF